MGAMNDRLLGTVTVTELRPASRRALLRGGGKALGGGAVALSLGGIAGGGLRRVAAQDDATPETGPFESELDVLNYALTPEHLEATFSTVRGWSSSPTRTSSPPVSRPRSASTSPRSASTRRSTSPS